METFARFIFASELRRGEVWPRVGVHSGGTLQHQWTLSSMQNKRDADVVHRKPNIQGHVTVGKVKQLNRGEGKGGTDNI